MRRFLPLVPTAAVVVLLGTITLVGGVAYLRQNRLVNVGEEIRYDDFGFTVRGVTKSKTVGSKDQPVRAYGTFWIVDLDVRNHAKRVSYRMESHVPLLVDERGRELPVSGRGQGALDAQYDLETSYDAMKPSSVGPGQNLVTPLVFDVPDDAGDVRLKLVFGGAVGEVLDYVFLGRRRFVLR
jgi:hypothetical protein